MHFQNGGTTLWILSDCWMKNTISWSMETTNGLSFGMANTETVLSSQAIQINGSWKWEHLVNLLISGRDTSGCFKKCGVKSDARWTGASRLMAISCCLVDQSADSSTKGTTLWSPALLTFGRNYSQSQGHMILVTLFPIRDTTSIILLGRMILYYGLTQNPLHKRMLVCIVSDTIIQGWCLDVLILTRILSSGKVSLAQAASFTRSEGAATSLT